MIDQAVRDEVKKVIAADRLEMRNAYLIAGMIGLNVAKRDRLAVSEVETHCDLIDEIKFPGRDSQACSDWATNAIREALPVIDQVGEQEADAMWCAIGGMADSIKRLASRYLPASQLPCDPNNRPADS